ncbi:MAG: tRNA 2-thiouridine(34) synthase MnmA [Candidatus Omnitrophica bacterium]|nr:tRNA 2-thiouridine(34) synthase MnmA [Candidatus Omnitrophota bacterium]
MHRGDPVAVGLSGGTDSAAAALLLRQKGRDVRGVTLRMLSESRTGEEQRIDRAAEICRKLQIPHIVIDARIRFRECVVDYFLKNYRRGLTPNPCVICNRFLKFGLLLEEVRRRGIPRLATGHYARVVCFRKRRTFGRGADPEKSQEYFLSLVSPEAVPFLVFPLAEYRKQDVCQMAHRAGLVDPAQKESQDVCFVEGSSYADFIERHSSGESFPSGPIEHVSGEKIGRHHGIHRYTIGQRSGLGVSWPEPLYVVTIDVARNTLIVGERCCVRRRRFLVRNGNWFVPPWELARCEVKVRYRSSFAPVRCEAKGDRIEVFLLEKSEGVAPGQIAAFYAEGALLGGGVIER